MGPLLLLTLALSDPARADEPTAPTTPGEEVIVYGQAEIRKRRQELDQRLRNMGYKAVKQEDGKTVYRPEVVYYPSVIIDEDGYAILKRSPVRFIPPGKGDSKLRYLWCLPPFTVMCIRPGGRIIAPRKLTPLKTKVSEAIDPQLDAWVDALAASAMHERLVREIPQTLDATWTTGSPLEPGGEPLPTPEARRDAIVELWASRAQTPEGDAARDVISWFVLYEIQGSPWPVSPEQAAAAERRCGCDRRLLEPPTPAADTP